jgi:hypothetical protein
MTMRLLIGLAFTMVATTWRPASAQEVEQMGGWYYQASIDLITRVNSSRAFTVDDDEEWFMAIHCTDGSYMVAIMIHPGSANGALLRVKTLTETWNRTMTWRIDQREPVSENWLTGESGLAIRSDGATRVVEALLSAKDRFVMRFGHSGATYTVVLTVDGAAEAIGALNACN